MGLGRAPALREESIMKKSSKLIAEAATAASAGMHETAERLYRKVLARDPGNLDGHYLLGSLLAERGHLPAAEKHLNIAATLNPRSPYVWSNLGSLRRLAGDIDGALAAWTRAIELDPRSAEAWFGIGRIHVANENLDDAEACLLRVVGLKQMAPAWSLLASVTDKKGRSDEAIAYCRRALDIQPGNGSAAFLLARLEGRPMAYPPGDTIRTLFDGYADNFEQHLVDTLAYDIPRQLQRLLAHHAGERRFARVADLGCGTGLMGPHLAGADELVGIDLSPRMLDQARKKNLYTRLVAADLIEFLDAESASFDLLVAADVLIYMGTLDALFKAALARASPGALFAFSTETTSEGDWQLRRSGRYAHAPGFVRRCAEDAGWSVLVQEPAQVRLESQAPVAGHIHLLSRA
jgi:predicted TPR repeat methyltransferase